MKQTTMNKQDKRAHKQARKNRQNARGKQWNLV